MGWALRLWSLCFARGAVRRQEVGAGGKAEQVGLMGRSAVSWFLSPPKSLHPLQPQQLCPPPTSFGPGWTAQWIKTQALGVSPDFPGGFFWLPKTCFSIPSSLCHPGLLQAVEETLVFDATCGGKSHSYMCLFEILKCPCSESYTGGEESLQRACRSLLMNSGGSGDVATRWKGAILSREELEEMPDLNRKLLFSH